MARVFRRPNGSAISSSWHRSHSDAHACQVYFERTRGKLRLPAPFDKSLDRMSPTVATTSAALALLSFASADAAMSRDRACEVVTTAAERHARANKPSQYYCEPHTTSASYYVFAVRSSNPPPAENPNWVGSSLVGWYALRRKDGAVVEWDIVDEVPGRVLTPSASRRK